MFLKAGRFELYVGRDHVVREGNTTFRNLTIVDETEYSVNYEGLLLGYLVVISVNKKGRGADNATAST